LGPTETETLYTYNEQAEEDRLRKKEKNNIIASDDIVQGTINQ